MSNYTLQRRPRPPADSTLHNASPETPDEGLRDEAWHELRVRALKALDPIREYIITRQDDDHLDTSTDITRSSSPRHESLNTPYDWTYEHSLFSYMHEAGPTLEMVARVMGHHMADRFSDTQNLTELNVSASIREDLDPLTYPESSAHQPSSIDQAIKSRDQVAAELAQRNQGAFGGSSCKTWQELLNHLKHAQQNILNKIEYFNREDYQLKLTDLGSRTPPRYPHHGSRAKQRRRRLRIEKIRARYQKL